MLGMFSVAAPVFVTVMSWKEEEEFTAVRNVRLVEFTEIAGAGTLTVTA